jgi:O-antigen/teichoic acid export membrane protein
LTDAAEQDIAALAKGGRTNVGGFLMRLVARVPFLFIAGRVYGPDLVGRFALAVVVVELAALLATLGLKRGLAQALSADDRPPAHIVWDALIVTLIAAVVASCVLLLLPQVMYPDSSDISGAEPWLATIVFAGAMSDVSLAALAYRHNVKATVTARAVVEPWTISIGAWLFHYVSLHDGLILAYMTSMLAALAASLVPFMKTYGLPHGWRPHPGRLFELARRNIPLAGADAIEWATRNVDRFILGVMFEPKVVGIYYMAQQIASLPGKLKTSFDPILGPVITDSLARDDKPAIAQQVRQVAFWIIAAQACLALMGSIPGGAVMGLVGPQFVAGVYAMGFLLTAEVLASTGAVCESALVYIARHLNLTISVVMLSIQIALSFALIAVIRSLHWSLPYQAAGPALALMLSVSLSSLIKANLLSRLLEARVSPLRWTLLWAVLVTIAVGSLFTALPHRFEWAELIFGLPAIFAVYWFVLWRWAFGPEDRALFSKFPKPSEATLPAE